ncbi:MAG: deoxynucleoside kinase [Acidobacteriota bacterium]
MRFKLVAVEGPIGVGKTSLVERLARRFEANALLEDVHNPFLRDFYTDKSGSAFQAQLFFLLNRHQQQRALRQTPLFERFTFCDYLFAKDKIFAYLNLNDSELVIYEKLYALLDEEIPQPDLVIYLNATTEVLRQRIRRRQREFEQRISDAYLEEVNRAYNHFFFHYRTSPLLVINTSEIDFVQREDDFEELVRQVESMKPGIQYFTPLGSSR